MCKLVFAQLVGLISVALFRPGLAAYGDPLTIGALFSKDNSEVELAFKYAVQWHNIYSSEGTHYLTDVRKVPVKNMFTTSKIVCNMTNTRPGVIAIFGYESARTSPMSRSVCKKTRNTLHRDQMEVDQVPAPNRFEFLPGRRFACGRLRHNTKTHELEELRDRLPE
uniref:Uncharacterized protein n=1 Tax=Photinus pyralis TaxID=7054 RepID=A0A1Y1KJB6_PHOPY